MTIRLVLADDHALVRAGLRMLLGTLPDIDVVGEAEDGVALLAMSAALKPDLVLMDIAMPKLGGLQAASQLLAILPEARIIVLSMHQEDLYVRQALRTGVRGYLVKDSAPAELEMAIRAVALGDVYLSPAVSKAVVYDYVDRLKKEDESTNPLTPRQTEVLKLIAQGQSTKEIARELDLSVKTVDTHRSQLMKQLDVHEVTGLVRYAMRTGLISAEH